jgi:hypothetical protein
MSVTAPPVIRTFEAVSLAFPRNATMPPGATAPICLLCQRHSHLPPAKTVWISAGGDQGLFLICSDCGWNFSEDELEAQIAAKVAVPDVRNAIAAE